MSELAIKGGKPIRRAPFARFPEFDENELNGLREVLESGVWGGYNPKVKEFEDAFAAFQGSKYGITAANGTVTLEAALLAAGVGPGDEVIVPPISFVATATAVLRVGAMPVFVDVDPSTINIDPSKVAEVVNENTRAIIPVHFAGHPADMDAIMSIAERHDLKVIEDCAHAHGATWNDKPVGSFGDFGSFSFQASKNLTAGEGGFLTANDDELAELARSICNQGRRTGGAWYEHVRLGTNYRITGWQAAILLAQLEKLPRQLRIRAENAQFLNEQLNGIDFISVPSVDERVTRHSYYLYLIKLDLERYPTLSKTAFVKALSAEGIPCADGYPHPLYVNEVFNNHKHGRTDCPVAERMCVDTIWLSHDIMLSPSDQLTDVTRAIEKIAPRIDQLVADGKGLGAADLRR
jgi:dTDP-4-amino-4,6-dideoxygalactose transaminase